MPAAGVVASSFGGPFLGAAIEATTFRIVLSSYTNDYIILLRITTLCTTAKVRHLDTGRLHEQLEYCEKQKGVGREASVSGIESKEADHGLYDGQDGMWWLSARHFGGGIARDAVMGL